MIYWVTRASVPQPLVNALKSRHSTRTTNKEEAPHLEGQGNTETCHLSGNKRTIFSLKAPLYDARASCDLQWHRSWREPEQLILSCWQKRAADQDTSGTIPTTRWAWAFVSAKQQHGKDWRSELPAVAQKAQDSRWSCWAGALLSRRGGTALTVKGCCWIMTPEFLAPRGEFNLGPEMRLDHSELLCNKVLLKYKGDKESFWHRHQKGAERVSAC